MDRRIEQCEACWRVGDDVAWFDDCPACGPSPLCPPCGRDRSERCGHIAADRAWNAVEG